MRTPVMGSATLHTSINRVRQTRRGISIPDAITGLRPLPEDA